MTPRSAIDADRLEAVADRLIHEDPRSAMFRTIRDAGWLPAFREDPDDPEYIIASLVSPDRMAEQYVGRFHGSEALPPQS